MFLQSIFTLLVAVEGRSALRTAGLRLRALSQNPPAAPVARFSTKGEGGSPSPKDWMAFLSGIPAAAVVATATAGLAAAIGGDAHDDSTQDCTANAEPPQRVQPGARIGDEPECVTQPNDPAQESLWTSLARAGPNLDLIMGMPTGNSSRPGRFSASQSDTHE
jgi:hypothetical protein